MNEFFGPGGVLAQKLGDYEFRRSQIRMADAVYQALDSQNHLIVEAGTGTGKTLAYLLPALLHGQRILVSTGTKTLQDQIFYKDIPLLEQILERPIRSAYLKGRSNYLCRVKLESAHAEGLFTSRELRSFQKILDWSQTTSTGDQGELGGDIDADLWARLDARRERCLGSKCHDFDRCFLTLMRQKAMESDIVVVNHHLFFADLAIRNNDAGGILPDYTAVIFDEAHELEEVATEYFGFHVSNLRIAELIGDARRLADKTEIELTRDLEDLSGVKRAADHFFGALGRLGEGRHPVGDFSELEGIDALIGALHNARQSLKKQKDISLEWEALQRRAGEMESELEVFRDGKFDNYVSWIERRGRGVFLEACPVDVSGLLRESLFARVPSCVMTSATLTVAESFAYFRQRIGIEVGEELVLSTEFNVRSQAMLYVPKRMPDYRHPAYLERAVEEIRTILNASRGRAFVLFTSYQQMMAAHENVSADLPWPCLVQTRSVGKTRLLEEFRTTPNAVLFATSSFWQGVDVKGAALSAVIIDKLPFQVPSDPLVSARMARVEREGGSAFADYQLPHAILRLKQGLGRLIRSKSDRGLLAILDNRLSTKSYGKLFMASLPDYTVTDNADDLVEFMREELPF
jgi:ATP-dependent DNA helicase DinG